MTKSASLHYLPYTCIKNIVLTGKLIKKGTEIKGRYAFKLKGYYVSINNLACFMSDWNFKQHFETEGYKS